MAPANPDTPLPAPDVAERLDRLPVTRLHLFVLTVCALGFVFDLIEVTLGSVLSAVFSMPPHAVGPQQLAVLLSSMYVGAVIGAPALGWVADRYGRRLTLAGVLLWLGLSSGASAFSPNLETLTACRALAGLALGAYPPLMIAYLTDLLPPGRRGLLFMAMTSLASLGPPIGIFGVRAMTPLLQSPGMEAWRWGLGLGALGAFVVGGLFFLLPESPRWLKSKGRDAEADRACAAFERSRVVMAAAPGGAAARQAAEATELPRRPWPRVATLFLLSPWATVAFPLLAGALLAQKGFGLQQTLLYVGVSTFGPLIGNGLAALGLDRLDRRMLLVLCAVGMIGAGALFVQTAQPELLVLANLIFGVAASVYVSAMNLYGAELFPTARRAVSLAGAWSMNRLGAVIAPLLLLPLLKQMGPIAMFAVIAATLVASIVLLALSPQGLQRKSVS